MIMDKKGRLFGKINLLDALIVLIVICFLAVGAVKMFSGVLSGKIGKSDGVETEIVYTIEITRETPEFFDKIKPGDAVFRSSSDESVGEIVACDVKPARYLTENKLDLTYEMTEVEGRCDGYITVKSKVNFEYPDFVIEEEKIKIGEMIRRDTREASIKGYVVALEYDEKLVEDMKNDN